MWRWEFQEGSGINGTEWNGYEDPAFTATSKTDLGFDQCSAEERGSVLFLLLGSRDITRRYRCYYVVDNVAFTNVSAFHDFRFRPDGGSTHSGQ